MNKVYKFIWNKAKHCYVVVSELAKSQGKSSQDARPSRRMSMRAAAVLAAFLVSIGGGTFSAVQAADATAVEQSQLALLLEQQAKDSQKKAAVTQTEQAAKASDKKADTTAKAVTDDTTTNSPDGYYVKQDGEATTTGYNSLTSQGLWVGGEKGGTDGFRVDNDGNVKTTGTVKAGNVEINKDNKITGLSNTTWDKDNIVSGQAATEDQLQAVAGSVDALDSLAVKYDSADKTSIDFKGNGGTALTNVKSITTATNTDGLGTTFDSDGKFVQTSAAGNGGSGTGINSLQSYDGQGYWDDAKGTGYSWQNEGAGGYLFKNTNKGSFSKEFTSASLIQGGQISGKSDRIDEGFDEDYYSYDYTIGSNGNAGLSYYTKYQVLNDDGKTYTFKNDSKFLVSTTSIEGTVQNEDHASAGFRVSTAGSLYNVDNTLENMQQYTGRFAEISVGNNNYFRAREDRNEIAAGESSADHSYMIMDKDGSTFSSITKLEGTSYGLSKGNTNISGSTVTLTEGQSLSEDNEKVDGTHKAVIDSTGVVLTDSAKKDVTTSLTTTGLTTTGTVKAGGITINNGGKITGLTAGTADTDAVNKKQLTDTVKEAAEGTVKWEKGTDKDGKEVYKPGYIANENSRLVLEKNYAGLTDGQTNILVQDGSVSTNGKLIAPSANLGTDDNVRLSVAENGLVAKYQKQNYPNNATWGTTTQQLTLDKENGLSILSENTSPTNSNSGSQKLDFASNKGLVITENKLENGTVTSTTSTTIIGNQIYDSTRYFRLGGDKGGMSVSGVSSNGEKTNLSVGGYSITLEAKKDKTGSVYVSTDKAELKYGAGNTGDSKITADSDGVTIGKSNSTVVTNSEGTTFTNKRKKQTWTGTVDNGTTNINGETITLTAKEIQKPNSSTVVKGTTNAVIDSTGVVLTDSAKKDVTTSLTTTGLTTTGTVKAGDITINNEGKITGLTAGTADTDAVNVKQLADAVSEGVAGVDASAVKYDTDSKGVIDKTSVTFNPGGTATDLNNVGTITAKGLNVSLKDDYWEKDYNVSIADGVLSGNGSKGSSSYGTQSYDYTLGNSLVKYTDGDATHGIGSFTYKMGDTYENTSARLSVDATYDTSLLYGGKDYETGVTMGSVFTTPADGSTTVQDHTNGVKLYYGAKDANGIVDRNSNYINVGTKGTNIVKGDSNVAVDETGTTFTNKFDYTDEDGDVTRLNKGTTNINGNTITLTGGDKGPGSFGRPTPDNTKTELTSAGLTIYPDSGSTAQDQITSITHDSIKLTADPGKGYGTKGVELNRSGLNLSTKYSNIYKDENGNYIKDDQGNYMFDRGEANTRVAADSYTITDKAESGVNRTLSLKVGKDADVSLKEGDKVYSLKDASTKATNNAETLDGFKKAGIVAGTNNGESSNLVLGTGSVVGSDVNNAVVVGRNADVSAIYGTALGDSAKVYGVNSVAIGSDSVASENNVVSIGSKGQERKLVNVADGTAATDAATVRQLNSVSGNTTANKADIDKLHKAGIRAGALGTNTERVVSLGYSQVGNNVKDSVAINGRVTSDNSKYQIALGGQTTINGAMALGHNSYSEVPNSVALGYGSAAIWDEVKDNKVQNVVSIGSSVSGTYRRLINVADGENAHDAATYGQLTALQDRVNGIATPGIQTGSIDNASAKKGNVAIGTESKVTGASNSIAIGRATIDQSGVKNEGITGEGPWNAIAIGGDNTSVKNSANGIALGAYSEVTNSNWGTALGSGTTVRDSEESLAIGHNAKAINAYKSTAVGYGAAALDTAFQSAAFGPAATVKGFNTVALGSQSFASGTNSVALGSDSAAAESKVISVGHKKGDKDASGFGYQDDLFRKVTNVAAGTGDHDATIVSQFKGTSGNFLDAVGKFDWKYAADNATKISDGLKNLVENKSTLSGLARLGTLNASLLSVNATQPEAGSDQKTQPQPPEGSDTGNGNPVLGNQNFKENVTVDKNLTVSGTTTTKDLSVNGTAKFANGADMGGQKVTNVGDGEVSATSKDAVNGSQLYSVQQDVQSNTTALGQLGGTVAKLDRRVDQVGAGAAALAALHPLDYDPLNKWDFAAGYGNYRGASAVAVGTYYRPNENTMLSLGGSFGSGENMVNAGVSFKFGDGRHDSVGTSRAAMASKIDSLESDNKTLTDKLAAQDKQISEQGKQLKEQDATIKEMKEQIQQLLKAQQPAK